MLSCLEASLMVHSIYREMYVVRIDIFTVFVVGMSSLRYVLWVLLNFCRLLTRARRNFIFTKLLTIRSTCSPFSAILRKCHSTHNFWCIHTLRYVQPFTPWHNPQRHIETAKGLGLVTQTNGIRLLLMPESRQKGLRLLPTQAPTDAPFFGVFGSWVFGPHKITSSVFSRSLLRSCTY
jgi:hypothetical protein